MSPLPPPHVQTVIKLHLLEGSATGPRVAEMTHSNSKAIACPRASYRDVRERPDLARPSVYLLVYPPPETGLMGEKIYIGQTDSARDRMDQHVVSEEDWLWFVLFTSRDGTVNNAHAQYLESRLIEFADQAGRAQLANAAHPTLPTFDATDTTISERFLQDILIYCPLLGIRAFEIPPAPAATRVEHTQGSPESPPQVENEETEAPKVVLHLDLGGIHADGIETSDGFFVGPGSIGRGTTAPSLSDSSKTLRHELTSSGYIEELSDGTIRLPKGYLFNSPSQAACVLAGYEISGRLNWKDARGRNMNEIEHDALTSNDTTPKSRGSPAPTDV